MSNRLKSVIGDIIHEDQCGYIKGRNPSMILRTLDDILEYTDHMYMPGALLALDYTKAYDTLSKDFILKTYELYGFGNNFIKWVNVLCRNTVSSINYCGKLSSWFNVERGIRQGCPFSPLCFILAVEILSSKIRQSKAVIGIKVPFDHNEKEIKILQYADDTSLVLNDERSIQECFKIIDQYSNFSGLKLNKNKTQAIWMGCWKYRRRITEDCTWNLFPNNIVKILGITLSSDKRLHELPQNWESKFLKCESTIKSWKNRNISIAGKITLVKSLLCPQFTYLMQATFIPDTVIHRINRLFFKFVWDSQKRSSEAELENVPERISHKVLIQPYSNGGLNMIDMHMFQKSLALKWIVRLYNCNTASWQFLPKFYYKKFSPNLTVFKSHILPKHFRGNLQTLPYFYHNLLVTWLNISYENNKICDKDIAKSPQVLWNNSLFMYKNTCIYQERWIKKGISFLSQIVDDSGKINYNRVTQYIEDSPVTKFEFNSVYNAIRKFDNHDIISNQEYVLELREKSLTNWKSKELRHLLAVPKDKDEQINNWWTLTFAINLDESKQIWSLVPNITKEQKLIVLQWKILHKLYATNIYLKTIGISDTDQCRYCKEKESLEHFFFSCKKSKPLWVQIQKDLSIKLSKQIRVNEHIAMLGIYNDSDFRDRLLFKTINLMIIVAKLAISKFKKGNHPNLMILYEHELAIRINYI